jgi:hypothetical protein
MDRLIYQMLNYIKAFYEKYPDAKEITEEEMGLYLSSVDQFNFGANNAQFVKDIFMTSIKNRGLTLDVIEHNVEKHMMAKVLDKVGLVLNNNQSGQLSTIQDDIDEYHAIIRNPPRDVVEYKLDLKTLIKQEITNIGIPFVNPKPNSVIRGMRSGTLGLIYAYVNTGKTSYGVANLCSVAQFLHAAKSDRTVVYACNEEDVSRVTLRAIQCMTNWSDQEIEANENMVAGIINNKGFNHIRFVDHVNTMHAVEKLLTKHNPRVMFIDQGTKVNIKGSKKEGVDALEQLFNTYRDLAKRHKCTIISMAQGGDACFEKKYPTLRDIYGSKSALQGELDWAIAIGTDNSDSKYAGWRYFNISKNKGDEAVYACRFDHKRCQFTEVV